MGFVLVETTGDGSVYVQDNGTTAQIIVEVGVGQMTNADFAALLATKENALGNPAFDGYALKSTAAGVRYWEEAYTHPSQAALNLTSESGKAIKSLQSNSYGHVTGATKDTVDAAADPLEIVDTDKHDLLVGNKAEHRTMIVVYGADSGSVPQYGLIKFLNKAGTVSFLPSKSGSITGVTLAKYENGNNIYLRITNNSGDTLWFEYSLKQYNILS